MVNNCDAVLKEKILNLKTYENEGGIFWKKDTFSLVEKLENGVILQVGKQKIAAILGGKAPEGMPVFHAVSGVAYGSEEYQALAKEYSDTRAVMDPRNLAPTYHGRYQEGVIPAIEDYLFFKGEELKPFTYKTEDFVGKTGDLMDRTSIRSKFTLE